ncbi:alpha/beta hydrolase [Desemzia sp. FAM 23991]|uniref:alpha/beta hydrolase n=1 Tax=unclassified Desemzia TaxID=2685243 RepID=UPI00388B8A41
MKQKKLKTGLIIVGVLVLILSAAFTWYVSSAYEPEERAIEALSTTNQVEVVKTEDHFLFKPNENLYDAGLVFYQGGKVEEEAYAPLMQRIAEKGIEVYLLKMPFNLAVFDSQAAGKVIQENENISNWYVSGHSLGGVMASSFAEDHSSLLRGVIFLASYPAGELSQTSLDSLSIYGTNDEVLNMDSYLEAFSELRKLTEIVIEGGNHAQFGNYGNQAGDGKAVISAVEQQEITAYNALEFVKKTYTK